MCNIKKVFYVIVTFCFLALSFPFHSWSEEGSKSTPKDQDTQAQAPAQKHPQISFDSKRYDVGEVWEGEMISHTFTVKNTGEAQLDIYRVKPG